ncbi:acyl-CoA synthetase [Mycobacterium sp. NBC_00419]|uniref:acyl-CoA synthetase n=1 Tax=Mycobacterium sp. NBC_00419 TaxID=2975989 RepID=UPI002E1C47B0
MYPGTHAATAPERPAIVMAESGEVVTYGQLDENSARVAAALRQLGLGVGDVIAVLSDNGSTPLEIYWAAIRSGLYVTFVNWHLSAPEAAYIVEDSGAKVVFTSAGVATLGEEVVALVPQVAHWYAFDGEVEGHSSYADLLAQAGPRLIDQPRGSELLYSSGTTGRPKGIKPRLLPIQVDEPGDNFTALLSHGFGICADDVYLSPAPVYHAAPLKWCAAVHALGGTVVMMKRFDAEAALAAIQRYRVTVLQMVPTMFVRLLQLPEETRVGYDVSSLRLAVHAGAPCPPDVKDAMIDWWGPILAEYYGATEGHGVTLIDTAQWRQKRGSVGKAALGIVHVCDDDGNELATGQPGVVYFERDEPVFVYHNDPEKTSGSRHPRHENWSTVGDIGYLDEDGYLFLTDRKAFMIISGGVNIYPQEVENILAMHPQIHDVAVIGVPHAEMGQEVKAVVQLRNGETPSEYLAAEIIDYVRERLAHFKAPRTVDFIDDMPRSAAGKLVKRTLQDRYAEVGR